MKSLLRRLQPFARFGKKFEYENPLTNRPEIFLIYRKTGTASTFLMSLLKGAYATTPLDSVKTDQGCYNTEYPNVVDYLLNIRPSIPINVIVLTRDPFTRHVSQFFKNLHNDQIKCPIDGSLIDNPFRVATSKYDFTHYAEVFTRANRDFCCHFDSVIEDSFPRLFGINPEELQIKTPNTAAFAKSGRFRLLAMRNEDIPNWSKHMKIHFGVNIDTARSTPVNAAKDTKNANAYFDFRRRYEFSKQDQQMMKELQSYQIYYSESPVSLQFQSDAS